MSFFLTEALVEGGPLSSRSNRDATDTVSESDSFSSQLPEIIRRAPYSPVHNIPAKHAASCPVASAPTTDELALVSVSSPGGDGLRSPHHPTQEPKTKEASKLKRTVTADTVGPRRSVTSMGAFLTDVPIVDADIRRSKGPSSALPSLTTSCVPTTEKHCPTRASTRAVIHRPQSLARVASPFELKQHMLPKVPSAVKGLKQRQAKAISLEARLRIFTEYMLSHPKEMDEYLDSVDQTYQLGKYRDPTATKKLEIVQRNILQAQHAGELRRAKIERNAYLTNSRMFEAIQRNNNQWLRERDRKLEKMSESRKADRYRALAWVTLIVDTLGARALLEARRRGRILRVFETTERRAVRKIEDAFLASKQRLLNRHLTALESIRKCVSRMKFGLRLRKKGASVSRIVNFLRQVNRSSSFGRLMLKAMARLKLLQSTWRTYARIRDSQLMLLEYQFAQTEKRDDALLENWRKLSIRERVNVEPPLVYPPVPADIRRVVLKADLWIRRKQYVCEMDNFGAFLSSYDSNAAQSYAVEEALLTVISDNTTSEAERLRADIARKRSSRAAERPRRPRFRFLLPMAAMDALIHEAREKAGML